MKAMNSWNTNFSHLQKRLMLKFYLISLPCENCYQAGIDTTSQKASESSILNMLL